MFEGVLTAMVTPFRNGTIDESALRDLVERQIEAGVDGLVPCGSTGESATLSHAEHRRVVEIVVQATRGRVVVVAGTGSNSTREAIELTQHAKEAGADGALLISPYYNKPTQEGIYLHYAEIARATSFPLLVYNIPGRTASNILPATLARIADVPQVVGVNAACGTLGQMSELIRGLARAVQRSDGRLASAAQDRAPGLIAEYKPPAVGTVAHHAPLAPGAATAPSDPATAPPAFPRPEPAPARIAMSAPAAATVTLVPQVEFESARPQSVPGLGMIQEVDDLSRAMAKLWMSEAAAYQGQRVALSIMNSRAPITGTLIDLTQDGLLIEQDGGGQVAVSYARLSGIDAA